MCEVVIEEHYSGVRSLEHTGRFCVHPTGKRQLQERRGELGGKVVGAFYWGSLRSSMDYTRDTTSWWWRDTKTEMISMVCGEDKWMA